MESFFYLICISKCTKRDDKIFFHILCAQALYKVNLAFDHDQKIWLYSKNIEHAQKNLNVVEIIFELADGTGINGFISKQVN